MEWLPIILSGEGLSFSLRPWRTVHGGLCVIRRASHAENGSAFAVFAFFAVNAVNKVVKT